VGWLEKLKKNSKNSANATFWGRDIVLGRRGDAEKSALTT
jgi:hypothetical protein